MHFMQLHYKVENNQRIQLCLLFFERKKKSLSNVYDSSL
jgi:hypothetical protein